VRRLPPQTCFVVSLNSCMHQRTNSIRCRDGPALTRRRRPRPGPASRQELGRGSPARPRPGPAPAAPLLGAPRRCTRHTRCLRRSRGRGCTQSTLGFCCTCHPAACGRWAAWQRPRRRRACATWPRSCAAWCARARLWSARCAGRRAGRRRRWRRRSSWQGAGPLELCVCAGSAGLQTRVGCRAGRGPLRHMGALLAWCGGFLFTFFSFLLFPRQLKLSSAPFPMW